MGSGFRIREVGSEVAGMDGNLATVGLGRGNDRRVPRSVIRTVGKTYPGLILQGSANVRPACAVIYGHLSHPTPGVASCIKSWVFPRWAIVFLGVAFFLLERVQKNLEADFLA